MPRPDIRAVEVIAAGPSLRCASRSAFIPFIVSPVSP